MKNLILKTEALRCLYCADPPCSKACPGNLDPAGNILDIRLENAAGASRRLKAKEAVCEEACGGKHYCQNACIRGRADRPVDIPLIHRMLEGTEGGGKKAELSTMFLGFLCENPFLLSSSCVSGNYEMCARALKEGWGGLVYKTVGLYIAKDVTPRFEAGRGRGLPFDGFQNQEEISARPTKDNFRDLERLCREFPEKFIVASIMGKELGDWKYLAVKSAEAGVKAIECNVSCPHMGTSGMGIQVSENLNQVTQICRTVSEASHLPVLAKLPYMTSGGTALAEAALKGGAAGITAINTMRGILHMDSVSMTPLPDIGGKSSISGCSGNLIHPFATAYICELKQKFPDLAVSGTGGVENWQDAMDFLLAGASTVQVTTAVMELGYRVIHALKEGLSLSLGESGKCIKDITGAALDHLTDARHLRRDILKTAEIKEESCLRCGRCYIACQDAGHQAVTFSGGRKPKIQKGNCVGCGLCTLVCPAKAVHLVG